MNLPNSGKYSAEDPNTCRRSFGGFLGRTASARTAAHADALFRVDAERRWLTDAQRAEPVVLLASLASHQPAQLDPLAIA